VKVAIERFTAASDFGGELGGFALSGVEQLLLLFAGARQGFQPAVSRIPSTRVALPSASIIRSNDRRIFLKRSLRFCQYSLRLLIPCAAAPEVRIVSLISLSAKPGAASVGFRAGKLRLDLLVELLKPFRLKSSVFGLPSVLNLSTCGSSAARRLYSVSAWRSPPCPRR